MCGAPVNLRVPHGRERSPKVLKLLVTGGARSGKSGYAQRVAESRSAQPIYLATATRTDPDMGRRIDRHRADRAQGIDGWSTVEEPLHIAPLLQSGEVVLVDCLTLWLTNLMLSRPDEEDLSAPFETLCQAIASAPNDVILVTNEVGLGIHPATPLGRAFRDQAGFLAQRVAAVCDRVVFMAAGLPMVLKPTPQPLPDGLLP